MAILNTQNAELKITAGLIAQFPSDALPQIALSGRSNVGKSSLINSLLNRKSLARVSSSPGKTITINFYSIDKKLYLVDLPGYGYAKRTFEEKQRWSKLTDGYFTGNKNIDRLKLVVQLIDSRTGPTKDDETMLNWLRESNIPFIVAVTKIDKLNKTERAKSLADISNHPLVGKDTPVVPFSALKNEGRSELWQLIISYSGIK